MEDSSKLWSALAEVVEQESGGEQAYHKEPSGEASFPVGDRLAASFLNGFVPTLLLYLGALILGGLSGQGLVLVYGILVAPILCWLFRSLACDDFGLNIGRFSAIAIPMVLLVPFVQIFSVVAVRFTLMEREARENLIWSSELVPAFQAQVDGMLRPISVVVLIALFAALLFGAKKLRERFPWLEFKRPAMSLRGLAAMLLVLPWLTLAYIFSPDSEIDEWTAEVAPLYESSDLGRLESGPVDEEWKRLGDIVLEANLYSMQRPKTLEEKQKVISELENGFTKLLSEKPPRSLKSVWAASRVASTICDHMDLTEDPIWVIKEWTELPGILPRSSFSWDSDFRNWLNSEERTAEELRYASQVIQTLLKDDTQCVREVDLLVFQMVYDGGRLPGPPAHLESPKGNVTLNVRDFPRPKPLEHGAWLLPLSPSELYDRYSKRIYLRSWLEMRPLEKDGFSRQELAAYQLSHTVRPDDLKVIFQGDIIYKAQRDNLRRLWEAMSFYIQRRLEMLETGEVTLDDEDNRWVVASDKLYDLDWHTYGYNKSGWRLK